MTRYATPLYLTSITLLAGWLRFWQLDTLPPGLWFDEGWVTLAARDAGNQIYFSAGFGGMHPAVVYLTRVWQQMSDNPRAIRYAIATVGTLCVPLAFFTFRAIFNLDGPHKNEGKALLGAYILAILYPFLHFSRLGFESMLPLPASLVALWLLVSPPRWWRTILLGVVLGVSIYTFDTGRFVPVAAAAVYWFVLTWHPSFRNPNPHKIFPSFWFSTHLGRFLLIVAIALLIGAPLLLFFGQNWDQLTARAAVTTYNTLGEGAESIPLALLRNSGRTLAGLSVPGFGDQLARHNLPGRPVFDPFLSLIFWIGLGGLLITWVRSFRISFSNRVLLCWLVVGLLPIVLTDGAPTYTRFFVAAAALPAAAGSAAWQLATYGNQLRRHVGTVVIGLLLLLGFQRTYSDYFAVWSEHPQLYDDFQVAQWEISQFGQSLAPEINSYFIPQTLYGAEPVYNLRPPSPHAIPSPPCLVLPPIEQINMIMVDQRLAKDALIPYQAVYPTAVVDTPLIHPRDGGEILKTLTIPAEAKPQLAGKPLPAQFGEHIQLLRWELIDDQLTFVWEALDRPAVDQTMFIHVYLSEKENETPIFQVDRQPCYPTVLWRKGERFVDSFSFSLPDGLTADDVTVGLGWYDPLTIERLAAQVDPSLDLKENRVRLPIGQ
ncbi:MAG: hypothetical protein QNJ45_02120 [Ardenticatenaceae bacterium]|nr:hypothetical protein [Ardenticatenaceae bacterium]